jgi:hypothetical protein
MDAHHGLSGAEIALPAPCGAFLLPGALPCRREATMALLGPITGEGLQPQMVLVTSCRLHLAQLRSWVRGASLEPDLIDTWSLDMLVHHWSLVVREFPDVQVVTAAA